MKCLKMAVGSIDFPFLADEILISSIDVRAQMTTVNELNNGGSAVFHTFYAYDPVRQITDDRGLACSAAAPRSTAPTPASPASPTTSPTISPSSRPRI